jgi:hypothetical protein
MSHARHHYCMRGCDQPIAIGYQVVSDNNSKSFYDVGKVEKPSQESFLQRELLYPVIYEARSDHVSHLIISVSDPLNLGGFHPLVINTPVASDFNHSRPPIVRACTNPRSWRFDQKIFTMNRSRSCHRCRHASHFVA